MTRCWAGKGCAPAPSPLPPWALLTPALLSHQDLPVAKSQTESQEKCVPPLRSMTRPVASQVISLVGALLQGPERM